MDSEPMIGALREKLADTALRELSRKRRRLGDLTPEQESAVETLLISTIDKISDLLTRQEQRTSEVENTNPTNMRPEDLIPQE